jgi:hypothetical protein
VSMRQRVGKERSEVGGALHDEEGVDEDVKVERGEDVARVVVVPQANLHRCQHRRIQQQQAAAQQLSCRAARACHFHGKEVRVFERLHACEPFSTQYPHSCHGMRSAKRGEKITLHEG